MRDWHTASVVFGLCGEFSLSYVHLFKLTLARIPLQILQTVLLRNSRKAHHYHHTYKFFLKTDETMSDMKGVALKEVSDSTNE